MIKGEVALRSGESAPLEYEIIKAENRWNSNGFSGCIGIAKGSRTPLRRDLQFVTAKNEMI